MCCINDVFCAKRRKIGVFSYLNACKIHEKCINIKKIKHDMCCNDKANMSGLIKIFRIKLGYAI